MDTGLDALKTTSKNDAHKAADVTGEFIGNKIAEAAERWQNCKTKTCNWWKSKECWRKSYSARKKRRNIKRIKTGIIKMEHYKISKLLSDSTVLKLVTKNGSK